jgi:hypothetical protein
MRKLVLVTLGDLDATPDSSGEDKGLGWIGGAYNDHYFVGFSFSFNTTNGTLYFDNVYWTRLSDNYKAGITLYIGNIWRLTE